MELQSGNYRTFVEANLNSVAEKYDFEVADKRIVFQPKGVNTLQKKAVANYARIIINTFLGNKGDYLKLSATQSLGKNEIISLNKAFNKLTETEVQVSGSRIVQWIGTSLVSINHQPAIKYSYIRQIGSNPYVYVDCYRVFNYDRMHILVFSYQMENSSIWKPLFQNVLNSFKITYLR